MGRDQANELAKDAVARLYASLDGRDRRDLIDLMVDELLVDMSQDVDELAHYACGELLEERRVEALEREQWGPHFADPTGRSALRAERPDNPRNLPCPTCGEPNQLTPEDRTRGYQCDTCADAAEAGIDGPW